jgi:hypothetical protein
VHVVLYLRQQNKKIGFVWLCFFVPRKVVFYLNLLSNKTLRYFDRYKIGFVFSKVLWVALIPIVVYRDVDGSSRFHHPSNLALFGFVFSRPAGWHIAITSL